MPITKSAKKALRQTARRAKKNLEKKEAYKNALKRLKKLITDKKVGDALKLVPQAYKAFDKAVKTGVMKKNTAARKKSQLMRWINKAKTA